MDATARKKHQKSIDLDKSFSTDVSIIIPFRNENGVVQNVLQQIQNEIGSYPETELLLVDDHSSDFGFKAIEKLIKIEDNIRVLKSNNEGKKAALATGIEHAKNKWIVTLDADVILPEKWLEYIRVVCGNSDSDLVILPVSIDPSRGFFQKVESLEFDVLKGITFSYAILNRPFLASGAHLAFKKSAYNEVEGYESHSHLASGDDVFLLESLYQSEDYKIGWSYHSDMTVHTPACSSLNELVHQKVRWAKKTAKFKSTDARKVAVLVTLANVGIIGLILFGNWKLLGLAWFLKTSVDVYLSALWFSVKTVKNLWFLPVFILVYPFYFVLMSLATFFIKPKWKGRSI